MTGLHFVVLFDNFLFLIQASHDQLSRFISAQLIDCVSSAIVSFFVWNLYYLLNLMLAFEFCDGFYVVGLPDDEVERGEGFKGEVAWQGQFLNLGLKR